ncbi:hypothetical protein Hypma_007614 [Hypsizygus marmoreus]|uniref:Uncharacterized protein n=1 Tax=Hypsizygus marmoreus TaxID=39966 RepID=A0A369JVV3_HYPMA|nr:hypothetical protein Hypma_007614 [Hypsizygus marmoreus]
MLSPRIQLPRACARRLQRSQRAFSDSGSPARRDDQGVSNVAQRGTPVYIPEARTAYIRLSRFLRSPVEGYAVMRALERKYGAIREFRLLRDYEVHSVYQNIVHVSFRDPETLKRIPETKETLSIVLPSIDLNSPGGVGLDELESVLESQEYTDDASIPAFGNVMDSVMQEDAEEGAEKTSNIVECTVERSKAPFYTPSAYTGPNIVRRRSVIADSFIKWGGFYPLEPIPTETKITDSELFGTTNLDHVRMRRVLRAYCDQVGQLNPYEIYPVLAEKPSTVQPLPEPEVPKPEWEPLPGHESSPEDTPMPSAVQAAPVQPEFPPATPTTVDTPPMHFEIKMPTGEISTSPPPPLIPKALQNAQVSENKIKKGSQSPPTPKFKTDAAKKHWPLPNQKDETVSFREIRSNALQERRRKAAETVGNDTNLSTSQRPKPAEAKQQDKLDKSETGLKDRLKGFMGGLF